ncbi:CPBP family intramembrane glutamic endopeptidase [Natrialbaceae archaeon AArc-T1-2]|uniref:CPBP family intramembrane glutamic endopeptidase n=1 Tax=Natrialbaceae archaeon AArc-T1-2 TaxID=3053904 RepID=UPI00255A7902|nr:CPBP family intramembrane glutamic endopeptidase [Natrialbaceae archaeon AArc-T1-2]WIV68118.1 CPBP family intramembrane metalloprotease [Natrialbaceae archaeon AArc-T1-2]
MPQWTTFAGVTGVVLVLLLVLSHLTQQAFADPESAPSTSSRDREEPTPTRDGTSRVDLETTTIDASETPSATDPGGTETTPTPTDEETPRTVDEREQTPDPRVSPESLSTAELLANVAISQGLFAGVLIGAAIYTAIPAEAFGLTFTREYLVSGLVLGVGVGLVLYVANELGAAGAKRAGIDHNEELRRMLAPDTLRGWLALLLIVLPIIAVFEELLFRAALIGVLAAGFDLSPWLLAVGSSVVFALGHGMQGTAGILVTGTLGFVLAAVFILTGSLLVVVVAHYLINALEFVVHEGLGLEWTEPLETNG